MTGQGRAAACRGRGERRHGRRRRGYRRGGNGADKLEPSRRPRRYAAATALAAAATSSTTARGPTLGTSGGTLGRGRGHRGRIAADHRPPPADRQAPVVADRRPRSTAPATVDPVVADPTCSSVMDRGKRRRDGPAGPRVGGGSEPHRRHGQRGGAGRGRTLKGAPLPQGRRVATWRVKGNWNVPQWVPATLSTRATPLDEPSAVTARRDGWRRRHAGVAKAPEACTPLRRVRVRYRPRRRARRCACRCRNEAATRRSLPKQPPRLSLPGARHSVASA